MCRIFYYLNVWWRLIIVENNVLKNGRQTGAKYRVSRFGMLQLCIRATRALELIL